MSLNYHLNNAYQFLVKHSFRAVFLSKKYYISLSHQSDNEDDIWI